MAMKNLEFKNQENKVVAGNIFCVGKNYADHAKEMGGNVPEEPVIFLKATSNLAFNNTEIECPAHSSELHYEGELVLYISKEIRNVSLEEAEKAIGGYAVGLDMTLRDLQRELVKKSLPWTLSKSFDNAAVLSPIIMKDEYKITGEEQLVLKQNGEIKQDAKINQMIFNPAVVVKYISDRLTLSEGDIIYTGTPAGIGKVSSGDKICVSITNIGELNISIK